MEPRRVARAQYEVMKKDLGVELTKLTNDSGKLSMDFESGHEDFEAMWRGIIDRQVDFLTRSLFIQEKYRDVGNVLEGRFHVNIGESSGENEVLPRRYAQNVDWFVTDSQNALKNHCLIMDKQCEQMEKVFKSYEQLFKKNMKDLRERMEMINSERITLSRKMYDFRRCIVEDSDSN